jgi:hypothetical protein
MRGARVGNRFRLRFAAKANGRRGMLVTFVQGIVGAGDEYFSPLDQASREETRDHAEDDFLQKGRVHFPPKGSRSGAMGAALPEAPLPRF